MNAAFSDYLADTRFNETPMLDILGTNVVTVNTREVSWGARLTDAEASGRLVTGPLTDDGRGSLGRARLPIADYYAKHQMPLIKRDLIEAAQSGQTSQVRNLFQTEMDDAMRAITMAIDNALVSGVGTLNTTSYGINGLNDIIKQTGTYAGLPHSNPRWKSIVQSGAVAGTSEALTLERVTSMLRARRKAGATSGRNDGARLFALTSDEIQGDVLRNLFADQVVLNSDYAGVQRDILPYAAYMIHGFPVVSTTNAELNNRIMFIDPSKLQMYQFNDAAPAAQNNPTNIGFFSYKGLQIRIAEVNRDHPDLITFELTTGCQLKAADPLQALSVLTDVSQ